MKQDATVSVLLTDEIKARAESGRLVAIDILRALTMVLMIFVNDLWSLTNVPAWLGHVGATDDGMGLADVVFPVFLFIVGLSIPYALKARRGKGASDKDLVKHVVWRTSALLVMGVWLVNGEGINASATGMPRYVWGPLCCLCFILIWNQYPERSSRAFVYLLRIFAITTLLVLAFIYRGGADDAIRLFGPRWWGILGMIGWAYLICALIAVAAKERIGIIFGAWVLLSILSLIASARLIPDSLLFLPAVLRDGTHAGLVMVGVLTALLCMRFTKLGEHGRLTVILGASSAGLIALSVVTRPFWGISKLAATPAWMFLCSAIGIISFLAIYWIAHVYKKDHWFAIIKPAGSATLLCYLMPHFVYFAVQASGVRLPAIMTDGGIGLLKALLFAMICVFITGALVHVGVKVKL